MIWATVSSRSSFCWLYRASPSLVAKNITNLISVLTIWWCPCVESSLVLLEEVFAMTSAFSWQNSVSLCPTSFCTPSQTCLLLQVSLDFIHLHSSPYDEKGILLLFFFLVLEGQVGLYRSIQLQLLWHWWLGHRLGLLWYWMVCLGNEQRSFCRFEIASNYCISDSFVDYENYSIPSKGFLPSVVDIMVIWIKFAHSCTF